ncbi:MAG: GDSL-type esterase/lipase family protein, partial [Myxococcota bacterium]|nr:GDSL-type esterase/lipase family protein [Myxococcota bacterium]
MRTDISTFKKLVFSGLIFSVFLILLEGVLSLIPTMLGFDQRGSYEKILSGGSTIITLGDSVTYGYGLPKDASWPSQLQRKIQTRTQGSMLVVNRAVSGMNSAEALQRERHTIEKIAQSKSRPIVLLMIGHNDLTGAGWRQWSVKNEKIESNRVRPPPRLWRILRWASDVSKKEEKINWKDPTVQKTLEKNV